MLYQSFLKKMFQAAAISAVVYLFFDHWHNWFFGGLVLFLYFLFVSAKVRTVLVGFFGFTESLRIRLLAIFLSLVTLGWVLGIFIFFNYFNGLAVFLSFFVNALVWSLVHEAPPTSLPAAHPFGSVAPENSVGKPAKIIVLTYLSLVIYGFYLLAQSKTGGAISSPWQVINSGYVWVFLSATFLLGALILLSKVSVKTLLFFVILQSFLLHGYLPLTHDLFYGADGWRHIGNEQRLLDNKGFKEAELRADDFNAPKFPISNFQFQKLKSKAGLLSYANFWGTNVVLAKMLQIDLISLTKWFLPIVWSIIFTILLYEIGLTLGWGSKKSLLLAWIGMLPFALQAGGSFSLPVNFGFLIFVLFFLLLLKRAKEPNVGQKNILLALGVGSALGYLLFFVLYWLSFALMSVISYLSLRGEKLRGNPLVSITKLWDCFALLAMTITAALVLPALEVVAKFSSLNWQINILAQAKQFIGNLLSLYIAGGLRPHDISGGNILFNQMPANIFTPNFLTQWLWWLPVFVLASIGFIIFGIVKNRKDLIYKFVLSVFVALLISYFLSFYLLAGERLFSRRLDATLAFLFLILLFYGVKDFFNKKIGILFVVVLSLAITASYTLGPDTYTVSSNQLAAAKHIWSQENNTSPHCVLGDTYPLLALEAVSDKEIIGGGFLIDANFGQPEREVLSKQMNIAINDNLLKTTATLTKTNHCWFMGETNNFFKQGILNAGVYKVFGDAAVVRYNTKY